MTTPPEPAPSTPSLAVLRERVHALEAGPEDVYALLEAMARPVAPDEDVPARAQALHRIIDDPVLGGLQDRDGRRVDETAVQALLDLGEPYASELSEEGQRVIERASPRRRDPDTASEALRAAAPDAAPDTLRDAAALARESEGPQWRHFIGWGAVLWVLAEVGVLWVHRGREPGDLGITLFFVAISAISLLVPGLVLRQRVPPRTGLDTILMLLLTGLVGVGMLILVFYGMMFQKSATTWLFLKMLVAGALVRFVVVGGLGSLAPPPEGDERS